MLQKQKTVEYRIGFRMTLFNGTSQCNRALSAPRGKKAFYRPLPEDAAEEGCCGKKVFFSLHY